MRGLPYLDTVHDYASNQANKQVSYFTLSVKYNSLVLKRIGEV